MAKTGLGQENILFSIAEAGGHCTYAGVGACA